MNNPTPDSRELNPAERNDAPSEIPTPEQQTEGKKDAQPHMPNRYSDDARPDHPPSDKA